MGQTLEYLLKLQDQFSGPLKHARDEQGRFTAGTKKFGESAGAVKSLSGAFVGLAGTIGAAFTAYKALEAGFAGFKHALNVASQMETTQTAFKTMLGSSAAMLETLGDIKKLAMETPFEFPELANAGKMLLAFGEAAQDIPSTLRRIGDVSSAIAAPIGEIAEIYGKARTQGQLFAEDINQLTGRGIPIIREFAKMLGLPESQIKKLAEEGKITFPLLDQAFRNLTGAGGQFFNMMAEQAQTSAGLWSTLKDGVNDLFLVLGTPLNDAIKPVLKDAISLADQLKPSLVELGTHMGTAVSAVREFVTEAKEGSGLATAMGAALWAMLQDVAGKMMVPFKAAWAGMSSIGADMIEWLTPVGEWFSAKMESAAFLFGRALMRQMAEVMAALPWGEGAALALNKAANEAGKQGNLAKGRADAAYNDIKGPSAEGAGQSLEKAAGKTRDVLNDALEQANKPSPYALPPSALDKDFNPMFPGGVLPPGVRPGKGKLPPSALEGPGAGGLPRTFFEALADKALADKAGAAGGTATGFDAAKAAATTLAAKGKQGAVEAAAKARPPVSAAAGGGMAAPAWNVPTGASSKAAADGDGGPSKIYGYSASQGGRMMGGGGGPLSRGAGPLSGRRATPVVPSPGTARRSQERREATAAASRAGGGGHPLMVIIKDMQAKLNTLAVAR
jgi:tape measure domain-containing protein